MSKVNNFKNVLVHANKILLNFKRWQVLEGLHLFFHQLEATARQLRAILPKTTVLSTAEIQLEFFVSKC